MRAGRVASAAALACLGALPTFAMTCEAEVEAATLLLGAQGLSLVETGSLATDGETCTLGGAVLAQTGSLFIPVDAITWTFTGFETLDATPPGPMRLDLRLEGARISAQTGDVWTDWMLREQSRRSPTDVDVAIGWTPAEGRLSVETFDIDMPGANRLTVSSEVGGVTSEALFAGAPDLAEFTVTGLDVAIENGGFLDGIFLAQLATALSQLPGSPDTLVASTLDELKGFVAGWPDAVVGPDSKAALAALIDDGPVPWGRLEIGLAEGSRVPLGRFVALGMSSGPVGAETLAAAFDGAEVEVRYIPAELPE